jgi:hypothetical protein
MYYCVDNEGETDWDCGMYKSGVQFVESSCKSWREDVDVTVKLEWVSSEILSEAVEWINLEHDSDKGIREHDNVQ